MRAHRHLLVAVVLIGMGVLPRTGVAQGAGTSADRAFYLTDDPTRVTCLLPQEMETEETTGRCYVVECATGGDRCSCPFKLPNGWKQPLSGEQCQQLGQLLRPLPPVEPAKATGREQPKAPSPVKQAAKGKDEDRNIHTVRLQAQGDGVQESVVLTGPTPITVAEGVSGLEALKGKLSEKELKARESAFKRAERFVRDARNIGPPGRSFPEEPPAGRVRVDVEILRGINFPY